MPGGGIPRPIIPAGKQDKRNEKIEHEARSFEEGNHDSKVRTRRSGTSPGGPCIPGGGPPGMPGGGIPRPIPGGGPIPSHGAHKSMAARQCGEAQESGRWIGIKNKY